MRSGELIGLLMACDGLGLVVQRFVVYAVEVGRGLTAPRIAVLLLAGAALVGGVSLGGMALLLLLVTQPLWALLGLAMVARGLFAAWWWLPRDAAGREAAVAGWRRDARVRWVALAITVPVALLVGRARPGAAATAGALTFTVVGAMGSMWERFRGRNAGRGGALQG